MIVPEFWAEGRARDRRDGRQVTVRRFGWSDVSLADAQQMADARAAEALRRVLAGEILTRREPKVPYNGAAGVPIREQIVSRHGDVVITRNSYGARCLNSPNALFADIDFAQPPPFLLRCLTFLVLAGLSAWAGWITSSWCLGLVLGFVSLVAAWLVAALLYGAFRALKGGDEAVARARIDRFAADHPDWGVRLYRTPAGLRLLVTHRPFDPNDPAVREFFAAVGADPVYVRMCLNQQCFRARVSPKPWRVGIGKHMKPRPGVWPVRPERLPDRQEWIAAYEAASAGFAACEFIDTVGSGVIHPGLAAVIKLHDDLSRATSGLPIA
jgi:hypothetical protein